MKDGDKVKVSVGEPWDFSSPEGDNQFSGQIMKMLNSKKGEALLIKVNKPFSMSDGLVSYVLAFRRHRTSEWKSVTVCDVPKDVLSRFLSTNNADVEGLRNIIAGSISVIH